MELKRKAELISQGLESIVTHTDEDSRVRMAVLDAIAADVADAKAAVEAEVLAQIEQQVG